MMNYFFSKRKSLVFYFLLAMILLLVGCGSSSDTSTDVVGEEFKFVPEKVTISKGEEVTMTFTNNDQVFHNLIVDNIPTSNGHNQIYLEAEVNEEDSVSFTATEAGTYEMYCDEPGHEQMVGTLVVEE
ncbi:plastocyanin/azurin family copper-binding protein [Evansella sp. AB-P1]|uniref:cupredoxin domain-containing protein n=1 Tax=Evansella sp. AB-P1 TaxID=3037653 RepID=UPI00241EE49D|nr:plastocyanin/azurin family copper-binding protein [Evansella sp. AB-P1]MDG5788827.1 plastocyanin/azurin family copper-binding protein [Evansella sp. AB-P1]